MDYSKELSKVLSLPSIFKIIREGRPTGTCGKIALVNPTLVDPGLQASRYANTSLAYTKLPLMMIWQSIHTPKPLLYVLTRISTRRSPLCLCVVRMKLTFVRFIYNILAGRTAPTSPIAPTGNTHQPWVCSVQRGSRDRPPPEMGSFFRGGFCWIPSPRNACTTLSAEPPTPRPLGKPHIYRKTEPRSIVGSWLQRLWLSVYHNLWLVARRCTAGCGSCTTVSRPSHPHPVMAEAKDNQDATHFVHKVSLSRSALRKQILLYVGIWYERRSERC